MGHFNGKKIRPSTLYIYVYDAKQRQPICNPGKEIYHANSIPRFGHAVGGAATHYGGGLGRFSPWSYQPVSMTISKYGQDAYNTFLSNVAGGTPDLEDWPVSYDDMVPYYKSWENAIGVVEKTKIHSSRWTQTFPCHPTQPQHMHRFSKTQ